MYVCLCNAVTDTDISNHLGSLDSKTSAKEAYSACTGGFDHVCGQCKPIVKDMVSEHNNKINVQNLSNATSVEKHKEPV
ncbi:MAG: (2Fe-2S)-binding protein [Alphaproteobacteria bacterium]